ncbi:hypothetical protein AVEN_229076-1 [Araneus ventricosus]|uniref:Uncharacterized protein n=1 Tax=Araneus ventricosus TaxID=182803 RepID=A0A4Y2WZP4_ARAVE|nr:hypothetical protein AVEN_229076-1 [Araneus ventricosus]
MAASSRSRVGGCDVTSSVHCQKIRLRDYDESPRYDLLESAKTMDEFSVLFIYIKMWCLSNSGVVLSHWNLQSESPNKIKSRFLMQVNKTENSSVVAIVCLLTALSMSTFSSFNVVCKEGVNTESTTNPN